MSLHVLFTEDGIPGWIGHDPREGSEDLPEKLLMGEEEVDVTVFFLAGHMRLASGEWVKRPAPPPPTAEDLARIQAEHDRMQAEEDARISRWQEEEIARRAAPDQLLRSMGKITIAELTARVAAIRAEVEAGR